jgi:hypothetical protein
MYTTSEIPRPCPYLVEGTPWYVVLTAMNAEAVNAEPKNVITATVDATCPAEPPKQVADDRCLTCMLVPGSDHASTCRT